MKYVPVVFFILLISFWSCTTTEQTVVEDEESPWTEMVDDAFQNIDKESVRYLYFPTYRIYYDLASAEYIYRQQEEPNRLKNLPENFDHLTLWKADKVGIYYEGDSPHQHVSEHIKKFPGDGKSLPKKPEVTPADSVDTVDSERVIL